MLEVFKLKISEGNWSKLFEKSIQTIPYSEIRCPTRMQAHDFQQIIGLKLVHSNDL